MVGLARMLKTFNVTEIVGKTVNNLALSNVKTTAISFPVLALFVLFF